MTRMGYHFLCAGLLGIAVFFGAGRVSAQSSVYLVQSGDTISGIASRFGIDPKAILSLNRMPDPNQLRPGQMLLLPGVLPPADPNGALTYTVQRGDTLSGIARAYNVSVEALQAANGLRDSNIHVGSVLSIPTAAQQPTPLPPAQPTLAPTQPLLPTPAPVQPTLPPAQPTIAPAQPLLPPPAPTLADSSWIVGSPEFQANIQTALTWLQMNDPDVYGIVIGNITQMQPSTDPSRASAHFVMMGDHKECTVWMVTPADVVITASLLYHEALHCQHGFQGIFLPSAAEEVYAYTHQIAFLERHGASAEQLAFYREVLRQYQSIL